VRNLACDFVKGIFRFMEQSNKRTLVQYDSPYIINYEFYVQVTVHRNKFYVHVTVHRNKFLYNKTN
jgi:hypothetical protein